MKKKLFIEKNLLTNKTIGVTFTCRLLNKEKKMEEKKSNILDKEKLEKLKKFEELEKQYTKFKGSYNDDYQLGRIEQSRLFRMEESL